MFGGCDAAAADEPDKARLFSPRKLAKMLDELAVHTICTLRNPPIPLPVPTVGVMVMPVRPLILATCEFHMAVAAACAVASS